MNKTFNLVFCNLDYLISDKNIKIEKKILKKAYNLNYKFMGIKIPKFKVILAYSRKEFDKLWGSKTEDFVSAFVKNDEIIIFAYEVINRETRWKNKNAFEEALVHEINHLFYQELRNDEYDPLWLSEGLATFIQHNKKRGKYRDKLKITKKNLLIDFDDLTIESYQIFTMFVEHLILTYGKNKLLKFIENLKENQNNQNLFKKIYKKELNELIKEANEYYKNFKQ